MTSTSFETRISALRDTGAPFAIATVVRTVNATSAKPGAKAVILQDGTIAEGWIGGGCIRAAVTKAALAAISQGRTQFISLRPEDLLEAEGLTPGDERDGVRFARNGCPSKGSMDIFVEPVVPQPELVICGSGPVALALVQLAGRFDFARTLCAPGLAPPEAPGVENLRDAFVFDTAPASSRFVIIATQGKGDEAALRAALSANASYIAFVGSRRKFETLGAALVASGVDPAALSAIKSPAGLDIHAITPDEIALSILSEVVLQRRTATRQVGGQDHARN
ncbi:XdhC family protein [Pseudogemmobacter sp. W21_MBD1_M6]|uniref:XdhC family protein n=1 Tax=Pseudogemmobacter sp. W21_MBD1_M6 TaxID=3240271 RepID=UPI003F9D2C2C